MLSLFNQIIFSCHLNPGWAEDWKRRDAVSFRFMCTKGTSGTKQQTNGLALPLIVRLNSIKILLDQRWMHPQRQSEALPNMLAVPKPEEVDAVMIRNPKPKRFREFERKGKAYLLFILWNSSVIMRFQFQFVFFLFILSTHAKFFVKLLENALLESEAKNISKVGQNVPSRNQNGIHARSD